MSLLSRLAVRAARAYGMLAAGSATNISADYLVVAGGGGGGNMGGAGAGGYQASTFTLSTLNTYSISVGSGGAGSSTTRGTAGVDSYISGTGLTTVTSTGGGGGGAFGTSLKDGGNGGSGGGGGSNGGVSGAGGTGISGQGNNGGTGTAGSTSGGGGGGASATGGNASGNNGGAGGNGSASSISGSSVTYAGGGGGSAASTGTAGAGGSGGGGIGSLYGGAAGNGTANLGAGGGGGYASLGGNGGSGIVIISYTSTEPKFVGGTITTSGGKQIHTFTSSGTLSPITPITASYLVVAGGGGGAGGTAANGGYGGGGAGGLQASSTTLYSGATYIVTVGAGGSGSNTNSARASNGSDSILSGTGLSTITSTGGGGGANGLTGANGGSGGGGSGVAPSTTNAGGTGVSGQGYAGGSGVYTNPNYGGGGGGGSGAVGANGTGTTGGNGGIGTASSISGTSTYYAGGGGGGTYNGGTSGTGGNGGGGNAGTAGASANNAGTSGTPNTGGGGGAASVYNSATYGGAGGSGIVIISYAGSQQFNGGLVTTSGGNTIHTFTSTGALTPLTNNLNNSLRFRSSASAYLSRTPASAGNRRTFTFSAWVKRGILTDDRILYSGTVNGSTQVGAIFFNSGDDNLRIIDYQGSALWNVATTQKFRDPSAWYHIVVAVDTTQATASNRVKMYVNGNQVTAFAVANYPSQNTDTFFNYNAAQALGRYSWSGGGGDFDGYMTDINFIDGQALEPYYFGNNDANGVWKPIQYKGTYGTNGFYLTFGNTTSTTTLGYDSSPNGNNWTCNNISLTSGSTYDAMLDVPTNTSATVANYAVLSPIDQAGGPPSGGNLDLTISAGTSNCVAGTIAVSSGKWYWEVTIGSTTNANWMVGIADSSGTIASRAWTGANGWYYFTNGNKYNNNTGTAYGSSYTTGDIIGIALDMDAGTVVFYKNNVSQGTAFSSLTGKTMQAALGNGTGGGTQTYNINFGQRPFSYTPPTGYVALNTYNLPTPTILQGNKYMDATLATGVTGGTQVITNAGAFKPDFIWSKQRDSANDNFLVDSVRGASKYLISNSTSAEATATQFVTSFNSNGFTFGTSGYISGQTSVNWQWQAGQGTTSSNTSGSITSTVSVNTTAGFSIVTYTGTLSSAGTATVGHGLGVAPAMIITKSRSATSDWNVMHKSLPNWNYQLFLNGTNAQYDTTSNGSRSAPTSSVFTTNWTTGVNINGVTTVAYCWAEIAGFSKFGSYTGNGSSDGPFVFCNFRPKWIMFKRTDSSTNANWMILDTSRDTYNVADKALFANLSNAELTSYPVDILSNGFKIRGTTGETNTSGGTYIVMAFAENPFKNANAR